MTQDQFYYCLSRILVLRDKISGTYKARVSAQAAESAQAFEQQVNFDSLRRCASDKVSAEENTAEAQALVKELAAQETKIRNFVPVALYCTWIEATHAGDTPLYVSVETGMIKIKEHAANQ